MPKAPYTPSPNNVKEFFQAIQNIGTPPKVDRSYFPSIGFKSSNDYYLVGVCKFLGFIDTTGIPTPKWNDFKDKEKAPQVMADSLRTAYSDLFTIYPDAQKRDDATLQNYFASKSGVAAIVAKRMVQTFKNLCEFANFEAGSVIEHAILPASATPKIKDVAQMMTGTRPITININIQLQLPATEDVNIYDSLFDSLKKHLFS